MDEMGVFPWLAHHSTSVLKHRGNVLSSVSRFYSLHCFSFISPSSHSTFPSIISHFPLHFPPSLWPNYFSLCSTPSALCLPIFFYIVLYNFQSSFSLISCIYLFFCLSRAHTLSFLSELHLAWHPPRAFLQSSHMTALG